MRRSADNCASAANPYATTGKSHARIPDELVDSPAFQALTHTAALILLDLLRAWNAAYAAGDPPVSFHYARCRVRCAESTFNAATAEICRRGFFARRKPNGNAAYVYLALDDWRKATPDPEMERRQERRQARLAEKRQRKHPPRLLTSTTENRYPRGASDHRKSVPDPVFSTTENHAESRQEFQAEKEHLRRGVNLLSRSEPQPSQSAELAAAPAAPRELAISTIEAYGDMPVDGAIEILERFIVQVGPDRAGEALAQLLRAAVPPDHPDAPVRGLYPLALAEMERPASAEPRPMNETPSTQGHALRDEILPPTTGVAQVEAHAEPAPRKATPPAEDFRSKAYSDFARGF